LTYIFLNYSSKTFKKIKNVKIDIDYMKSSNNFFIQLLKTKKN